MLKKMTAVIMDLTESEQEALGVILDLAESNYRGNVPAMKWSNSDRYMSRATSESIIKAMIDAMRKEFGLNDDEPGGE